VRKLIWALAALAPCALATTRPVLMEPAQVIPIESNLSRAATNGEVIVATSWSVVSPAGAPPEFLIKAHLYYRVNGTFVPGGLLYSERSNDTLGEVAMSSSRVALGLPSGVHVFTLVPGPGVHYAEDPVDGTRPQGLHLAFNEENTLLASASPCNWSVAVLTRGTGGNWSTTGYLPGYDRPCDEYRFALGAEFAVSGNRAVVWNNDTHYSSTPPEARVFERNGTTWNQTATITRPVGSELYPWQFGPSVSLNASEIFISGSTNGTHVFRQTNGTWSVATNLANYDAWRGTYGQSIDTNGFWLTQISYSAARELDVVHLFRNFPTNHYEEMAMLAAPAHDYIYHADFANDRVLARGRDALYVYYVSSALANSTPTFQDNFESGADGGWTPLANGQFSVITSGTTRVYHQHSTVGAAGAIQAADWTDQSIAADVKPLANQGPDRWVGLVTRYTDESNYYYVTLRDRDRVVLKRLVNGVYTELASAPVLVNLNQTYRLQLESSGTLHTVYVDGVRRIKAYDTALSHGHAGLRSFGARADYDNVVIAPGARRALFQSNFNEDFEIDAIERLSGSWSIFNDAGRFVLSQGSLTTTARAVVGADTDNQVIQTALRIRQFGSGSPWAGLMVRYVDPNNYYYVTVRKTGETSLRKITNGNITVLGSVPTPVTLAPMMQLRLEVIGTQLRVFVDKALVLERSDGSIARGRSGFVTYRAAASYDDYVAYQP
jgi:hypothetical protein